MELGKKALSFCPTYSLRNMQGSQAVLRNFMSHGPAGRPTCCVLSQRSCPFVRAELQTERAAALGGVLSLHDTWCRSEARDTSSHRVHEGGVVKGRQKTLELPYHEVRGEEGLTQVRHTQPEGKLRERCSCLPLKGKEESLLLMCTVSCTLTKH